MLAIRGDIHIAAGDRKTVPKRAGGIRQAEACRFFRVVHQNDQFRHPRRNVQRRGPGPEDRQAGQGEEDNRAERRQGGMSAARAPDALRCGGGPRQDRLARLPAAQVFGECGG